MKHAAETGPDASPAGEPRAERRARADSLRARARVRGRASSAGAEGAEQRGGPEGAEGAPGPALAEAMEACAGCPGHRLTSLREDGGGPAGCGMSPHPIERGWVLFREGRPAARVFWVRRGVVRAWRSLPGGGDCSLRLARAGHLVGLEGFFGGDYRSSAETLTDAVLCAVPMDDLRRLARESARIYADVCAYLDAENQEVHERVFQMGLTPWRRRIAAFLVSEFERRGSVPDMPEQALAEFLGLTAQALARDLGRLRRAGFLDTAGGRIAIRDLPALRRLALGEDASPPRRARGRLLLRT